MGATDTPGTAVSACHMRARPPAKPLPMKWRAHPFSAGSGPSRLPTRLSTRRLPTGWMSFEMTLQISRTLV